MFFIAGITGNVGGAAARRLLEMGHTVRTLARDPHKAAPWSEQGVDVRAGDLTDPRALASALEGVEGAFLLIPPLLAPSPDYHEARTVIASFLQAFEQTTPPRLALLSSIGAEQPSGLGNITTVHLLEQALDPLTSPVAFIRAGSFFENYAPALESVAATGVLHSFYAPLDRPLPMIATEDIGNQVAQLLDDGWSGRKIIELGSPYSPQDIARAMTVILGRAVEAHAIPRELWATSLERFGMAPGTTAVYEEMMEGFNSGWIHFGIPGTDPVAGTLTPNLVFERLRSA